MDRGGSAGPRDDGRGRDVGWRSAGAAPRTGGRKMARVSVREIARRTGYSPATVSNALNGKDGVSSKACATILGEANRLGYRRGGTGLERIRFVIARNSGVIVDGDPFHPAVITGVEQEARRYSLETTFTTLDLSNHSMARRQVRDMCAETTCGLVVLATEMTSDDDYALFEDSKAPLVMVDGWSDKLPFDTVATANESAAYRACAYLLEKRHERIGYLGGRFRIRNFPLRERGFRHALADVDIPFDERLRVLCDTTHAGAYADVSAWLDGGPELPTAIFCDNDLLAINAMRALSDHGISVPGDVSVIGFDDQDAARLVQPGLTTMRVPRQEMGGIAVRHLVEQASSFPYFPHITLLHAALVERESVRQL